MTRFILTMLACAACLVSPALADAPSAGYPSDRRMKVLEYSPDDIYVINTLYGYQTSIELDRNEEIETISVGDRSLWQLIPSGSRLFIRPMDENVSTNMTLITSRRSYQFDIVAGQGKPADNPDLVYVARFVYPETRPAMPVAETTQETYYAAAPVQAPPAVTETAPARPFTGAAPRAAVPAMPETQGAGLRHNTLYTFSGPDHLAPTQVYDDGYSTYLRFADMTEQPPPKVFIADAAGTQTQVPVVLRNGYLVVSAVAPRLAIVRDSGTVLLYNETMASGL